MSQDINDQLIGIVGESGSGKSASLRNLPKPEGVMYLNCESGKRLPFRNKFDTYVITDPFQVHEAFDHVKNDPAFHTIVIDSVTFLMDMFESQYVLPATNTQQAWGEYAQFLKTLMLTKVPESDKAVIILAHPLIEYDEKNLSNKSRIAVKGAVGKGNGLESYFSTVVATKKVTLKDLEPYGSDLLHIDEQDKLLGYKHVFQTRLTKETVGERIRSPMGLFSQQQTYIDNDVALLLKHLHDYYA